MRIGDNGDIATFIGNIEMINSQIAKLGTRPFTEEMVISKMLSNLPTTYNSFQTMWKIVAPEQQTLSYLQHGSSMRNAPSESVSLRMLIPQRFSLVAREHLDKQVSDIDHLFTRLATWVDLFMKNQAPRPLLPHEHQDSHYQRAQEIAARKCVSRCKNCGEYGH